MAIDRRDAIKIGLMAAASTVALATAGVLGGAAITDSADDTARDYAETYKGRHIRIAQVRGEQAAFIDGNQLHLMKMGDNAYLSSLCHYEFAETPLVAARRAVDELRGANLLAVNHHA